MAQYDPQVLQKYADKMYASATMIVVLLALIGAGLGGAAGGALSPKLGWILGAGLGLVVGVLFGVVAGFWYKLRAQLVLCQLQIEVNTRRP